MPEVRRSIPTRAIFYFFLSFYSLLFNVVCNLFSLMFILIIFQIFIHSCACTENNQICYLLPCTCMVSNIVLSDLHINSELVVCALLLPNRIRLNCFHEECGALKRYIPHRFIQHSPTVPVLQICSINTDSWPCHYRHMVCQSALFHDLLLSPISQHSVWSEIMSDTLLHWSVTSLSRCSLVHVGPSTVVMK